jgi:hypothetical protein
MIRAAVRELLLYIAEVKREAETPRSIGATAAANALVKREIRV